VSEHDALQGPFCAFKAYHRRAAKRPGQWTWRTRARRTMRLYRAWMARNNRISIRAFTAAARGPRAPKPHPLDHKDHDR
jgi:hypothetical protein